MCLQCEKMQFLEHEIRALSIAAAFQVRRGENVYSAEHPPSEEQRKALRDALDREMAMEACAYARAVEQEEHVRILERIANVISQQHHDYLAGGQLRIGIVQKAFNLYLKYLWCAGIIPEPPHCPFDNGVIAQTRMPNPPNWTAIDSREQYKSIVEAAQTAAGERGLSLAMWELISWNQDD